MIGERERFGGELSGKRNGTERQDGLLREIINKGKCPFVVLQSLEIKCGGGEGKAWRRVIGREEEQRFIK